MNYTEALSEKNRLHGLIGISRDGGRIDDILIAPVSNKDFEVFAERYILTLDSEYATAPFINSDLRLIIVIDRHRIPTQSIFFQTDIENLKSDPSFIFNWDVTL